MKKIILISFLLAGCQKSDIENCVNAHLEAYDAGSREMSGEWNRKEFKAQLYLICGQQIGTTKIDAQLSQF